MNVLIACEESQVVCGEFLNLGHNVFSCDIQKPSGCYPERHIQSDVTALLNGKCSFKTMDGKIHSISDNWDLIIAHPPCTYLSASSSTKLYPKPGCIQPDRYKKGVEAAEFFC